MLYQSLKLTNGIWVLAELKIQPPNPNFVVIIFCFAVCQSEKMCVCLCYFLLLENFDPQCLPTYIMMENLLLFGKREIIQFKV